MEKSLYKGKEIQARDLYKYRNKEIDFEKEITQAGHRGELQCPCEGCKLKIFYNRGTKTGAEKKIAPHFFHEKSIEKCEYDFYFKNIKVRNQIEKRAMHKCYEILKDKYPDYTVLKETKLVKKHWTDIAIIDKNRVLAIESKFKYKKNRKT